jgi:pimeloyl-ACP methyl ester carboxylesterase
MKKAGAPAGGDIKTFLPSQFGFDVTLKDRFIKLRSYCVTTDALRAIYSSSVLKDGNLGDDATTVVLVHGAWADGTSWSLVIEHLAAAGQRSIAVPLPLTSLADDVAALDRSIARAGGPVVVAGHAYGGAVMGAARSSGITALVYVAGLAPDEGETVADIFYRLAPHPLAPKLHPDDSGLIWLPENAFAEAFAPEASSIEQTVLAAVQRPIATACIVEPMARPLWRQLPSWYLIAEEDRMIPAENQRFMANRMDAVIVSRPADHVPLITAPETVAELILQAVHDR